MTTKLIAEEGVQKGLVLPLDEGQEWVIGRDPEECQLLIEDPSASRKHLVCRKSEEGIVVENLSQTNPIQINEEAVLSPTLLHNGDLIRIGEGYYRFYEDDEPPVITNGHDISSEITADHAINSDENSKEIPLETNHEEIPSEDDKIDTPSEHAIEDENKDKIEEALSQENMKEDINTENSGATAQQEPESYTENFDHISIFEDPFEEGKSQFPHINFDLTETSRWLLKVVAGPNHGAEFNMQPGLSYVIGTDPNSCDIVFHDTSVSRQHAKITLNEDGSIVLEDLKSRNGTYIEGNQLTGDQTIPTNTLVTMGTSSFVIYDREGEMQTIISPLLPSIVKVLKEKSEQEDKKQALPEVPETLEEVEKPITAPLDNLTPDTSTKKTPQAQDALGAFILIAILTGLFVVIGIGTTTLFKSQPVVKEQTANPEKDLSNALKEFPSLKYSFNRNTGRLLLVGHVLTAADKTHLLYNLQGLNYIKTIDDSGVIIDEGVWREINQILSQNQNWKGISIQSPTPGHFVISGFLKSRKQADQLWEYISANFPYLDLLEKRVIVEEDVVTGIGSLLQNKGFKDVSAQINEGDIILSGQIPRGKMGDFEQIVNTIKETPGVRNIKNFVTEQAPEQAIVNISDKYEVSGLSRHSSGSVSVIINGRILTVGDALDGMNITSIKPNAVYLEKDGTQYKIDYSHS